MTAIDRYLSALAAWDDVVHEVPVDRWGAPTPCTEWDVRALVNHMAGEALWAEPLLAGSTIAEVGDRLDGDLLGPDPVASWERALDVARRALAGDGLLERTVHVNSGETSAGQYLAELTFDALIHRWDLARAVGGPEAFAPDELGWLVDFVAAHESWLGAPGYFEPPVRLGGDAGGQQRLLALLGRG